MASQYGKDTRLTYAAVTDIFKKAANTHAGINDFAVGSIDFLDANNQNMKYPLLFLRPLESVLENNVRSLYFEMYMLVRPTLQDESALQMISDAEQYMYDVTSYVRRGPSQQDYDFEYDSVIPVNEGFNDRLYGWLANIIFTIPESYNYCEFPRIETLDVTLSSSFTSGSRTGVIDIRSNTEWSITQSFNNNDFVRLRTQRGIFDDVIEFEMDDNTHPSSSMRSGSFDIVTEGGTREETITIIQSGSSGSAAPPTPPPDTGSYGLWIEVANIFSASFDTNPLDPNTLRLVTSENGFYEDNRDNRARNGLVGSGVTIIENPIVSNWVINSRPLGYYVEFEVGGTEYGPYLYDARASVSTLDPGEANIDRSNITYDDTTDPPTYNLFGRLEFNTASYDGTTLDPAVINIGPGDVVRIYKEDQTRDYLTNPL